MVRRRKRIIRAYTISNVVSVTSSSVFDSSVVLGETSKADLNTLDEEEPPLVGVEGSETGSSSDKVSSEDDIEVLSLPSSQ